MMRWTGLWAAMACAAIACAAVLSVSAGAEKPAEKPAGDAFAGAWGVLAKPDAKGQEGGEKEFEDVLTFKDGQFSTNAGAVYGFGAVPYKVSADGTTFTADTESKQAGKARWEGAVKGNKITGTIAWARADGGKVTYTFAGEK